MNRLAVFIYAFLIIQWSGFAQSPCDWPANAEPQTRLAVFEGFYRPG